VSPNHFPCDTCCVLQSSVIASIVRKDRWQFPPRRWTKGCVRTPPSVSSSIPSTSSRLTRFCYALEYGQIFVRWELLQVVTKVVSTALEDAQVMPYVRIGHLEANDFVTEGQAKILRHATGATRWQFITPDKEVAIYARPPDNW
jgi:hypothetical protein